MGMTIESSRSLGSTGTTLPVASSSRASPLRNETEHPLLPGHCSRNTAYKPVEQPAQFNPSSGSGVAVPMSSTRRRSR